jgi:hypothetical protein
MDLVWSWGGSRAIAEIGAKEIAPIKTINIDTINLEFHFLI